jgi:transposase
MENNILNLPGFAIRAVKNANPAIIEAEYTQKACCPHCASSDLRTKDSFWRKIRHESLGNRTTLLIIKSHKFRCNGCGHYFNQRFPGILKYKRSTEAFRREIFEKHNHGICQSKLSELAAIGSATIERWYHDYLKVSVSRWQNNPCPMVMGIDEHFFSRKTGYATTICDLKNHRVFDVTLGRTEVSLASYFSSLIGKEQVRVVVMDLADHYRSLITRHLPRAVIVADRFHVIRLVNHHFLKLWQQLDPAGRRNRGLLSLMRRHEWHLTSQQRERLGHYFSGQEALKTIYEVKQGLVRLLLVKHQTARECRKLIPVFLDYIEKLKAAIFEPLVTLGKTLESWQKEVVRMWRFTRSNGMTEGFHNKMEMISRRAFGFRNFENYRLRVKALCA